MIGLTDVCVGPSFEYEALGSGLIATPTYCVPSFGEWEVVPTPGLQDASPSGGTGFELWTVFPEPGEFDVFPDRIPSELSRFHRRRARVCVPGSHRSHWHRHAAGRVHPAGHSMGEFDAESPLCGEWGVEGTSPDPAAVQPGLATQWRWCDLPQRRHLHRDLDNRGARRSEKRLCDRVHLVDDHGDRAPVVNFGYNGEVCEGDVVPFYWNQYLEGIGGLLDFGWTVDGQVVSTDTSPLSHGFDEAGTYEVGVFIENYCGTDSDAESVLVRGVAFLELCRPTPGVPGRHGRGRGQRGPGLCVDRHRRDRDG